MSRLGLSSARSPEGFYGWHVAAFSAVALAATAPGQTAAVSAFVDPMLAELPVSRSQLSLAYLTGTLAGALCMPWVGRALDRYGARKLMAAIGAAFGGALIAFSLVNHFASLTIGFVGIRLAGQGALGLTATTVAALWFVRRRGTVLGLVSAVGAVGISLTPIALERLIAAEGWRTAWVVQGVLVWLVVIPIAVFGLRNRPADLGQVPDGRRVDGAEPHVEWGLTRGAAMRTPLFWALAVGVAFSGMLATAVAFHQISLLGERGLGPAEAAFNFLPQTLAALAATVAMGLLVDRFDPRWLLAGSMALLAGALIWASVVEPGWSAIGFGLAIGAAGGAVRSLETGAVPRFFGTLHVGSIRGVVAGISVGSTAFGPLLFALGRDVTGSYVSVLVCGAALPAVLSIVACFVRPPVVDDHDAEVHPELLAAVEAALPADAQQALYDEDPPPPSHEGSPTSDREK